MSKKLIYLVSFALVLNLAGYVSAAEADVEIPSVGYPKPILDGVMDDVWLLSTEQVMTLFTGEGHVSVEPTSPEDCSGSWWALWDEEYLYVLVNVNDEALVQDSDPSEGWLDDRVEIFIDGDNAKGAVDDDNDYQYNFRWNFGEVETPVELYNSPRSLQGVEYGVATTDSGFLVEAKLPWSTMTGDIPQEDQLIGINVMIDDDDDGGGRDTQLRWLMEAGRPHIPSEWGTAMLIADKRVDVTAPGDAIQGVPNDGDWPGNETPDLAIDDDTSTKYLHFKGDFEPDPGTGGAGFQVTPASGPSIVTGLTLTTANDVPGRDPIAFELSGSNEGIDGPYELIASGEVVDFAQEVEWPRFTMNATQISFDNGVAYAHYQLIFTAIRGPVGGSVNSMQITEVELLGVLGPVAHWKFDDGEGTVAVDSSGNGNDGVLVGDPQWVAGIIGAGALEFAGISGQRVEIEGYDGILGTQNRTVMAWVKTTGYGDWISWGQNVNTQKWIGRVNDNAGNGAVGALRTECSGGYIISTTVLTDGDWYHVTSVLESTGSPTIEDITMYVDGVQEAISGVRPVGIDTVGGRNVWIADGHHDRPLPGLIDDVRLYDRALSADEILYLAGYRAPDNLVQNGTFDDDSAWTVIEHTVPAVTNIDLTYADDAPAKGEAPCLRVSADGVAVSRPLIYQKLTLTAGVTYQVTAAIKIVNFYGPASYPPGPWFQIYMNDAEPDPPADATFDWNPSTKLLNIMPWNDCFIGNSYEEVIGADGLMEELSGCSDIGDNTGLYIPPGDPDTEVDIWLVIKPGMWASSDVVGGYDVLFDNVGVYPVEIVVDDFESYNDLDPAYPESNRIFNAWIDGYDNPTNGSLVGYDNPPFAEQTIVHGGNQSMPLYYDNSVGYSEATLTLTYPRDWTENGVNKLTIWFRGNSDNAAETLYVALNGNAIVTNDNPDAAQVTTWTEWTIDPQAFADQGVNLTNVDTISLGLGNKNNPLAGGSGTMYFDDIRLYAPMPEP